MSENLIELASIPRSWPTDFKEENGNYFSTCLICERGFIGHKRRIMCRECAKEAVGLIESARAKETN